MENVVQAAEEQPMPAPVAAPKKIFGEEFAWAVFTVTVAYTYSIITLVQYLA